MSLHFHLLVEMDLRTDLAESELAVVRWLAGAGPEPASSPAGLAPLLSPDPVGVDDDPAVLALPGGQSASLVYRRVPAPAARPAACWSLALRSLLLDDTLYGTGFASLAWLGHHARQDGFFALVREELEPSPGWVFVTAGGWPYAVVGGEVGPLEADAPPPPASLVEALAARGRG